MGHFYRNRYLILQGDGIDTELRITSLGKASRDCGAQLIIFDSQGQPVNELRVQAEPDKISRVMLGNLLTGCDFRDALRCGNAEVEVSSEAICECAIVWRGVVTTQLYPVGQGEKFFNVRVGEGRSDMVFFLSASPQPNAFAVTIGFREQVAHFTQDLAGNGVAMFQAKDLISHLDLKHFAYVKTIPTIPRTPYKIILFESRIVDRTGLACGISEF